MSASLNSSRGLLCRQARITLSRYLSQPATAPKLSQTNTPASSNVNTNVNLRLTPRAHRQSTRWRPPTPATSKLSTRRIYSSNTRQQTKGTADATARQRLLISYHDLEEALEKRGLRSVRAVLTAILVLASTIGLAWPRIKQWGAEEGAEVAAASLQDEQLQAKFSSMVHDILNDESTLTNVESLLKNAVINLFNDEHFTNLATEWTAEVLQNAIMKDALIEKGTDYVADVFNRDDSIQVATEFLTDAINKLVADEAIQDTVASGLWSGIRASMVGRRRQTPQQPIPEESESNTTPSAIAKTPTIIASSDIDSNGGSERNSTDKG